MPGYNQSTNHYLLGGTGYDADGNVLNDTFNTYTWDADGKNLSTTYQSNGQVFSFTNDAFGHKVEASISGSYSGSFLTLGKFKLSATGQTPFYSEYPLPGGSILSQGGGLTVVQLADWLGTIRSFYSYTGGSFSGGSAHAPFGETYANHGGYPSGFARQGMGDSDPSNTTYYFPERELRSSQGRWLSPDPAGLGAADPANPQSWNRYAYVLNNPLKLTDPTGMYATNCGSLNAKNCANRVKQIDAFQAKLAASKDAKDRAIAKTLGTSKDTKNGVTIGFVKEFKNATGKTLPDKTGDTSGLFAAGQSTPEGRPVADVRIDLKGSLSGDDLSATVEHEGSHAADRVDFVDSCSATGCSQSLNLTSRQSEQSAFGAEYKFWQSVGQGQQHPMISSPDQINQFLGQHPDVYDPATLDNLLFPPDL